MNRKHFFSTLGSLCAPFVLPFQNISAAPPCTSFASYKSAVPPYLQPGDTIGITTPAGSITLEEIQPALQTIRNWGYNIKVGQTIGRRDCTFGGTDEERAADFQQLLDDASVKAILCARGGYGVVRMIDRLNWRHFKKHPKWVIGFSDVTVLHSHIHRHCGVATLHSKMLNSFPEDWSKATPVQQETILSIRDALAGKKMQYTAVPHVQNRWGEAEGELVGGNLKMLETLAGTASDIATDGKILFVEDTGEYLYSLDRMFWNLKRTGKLNFLNGLIVGGFKIRPDEEGEEFGRTLQDIVLEKVSPYSYPVCFDFPVGHQPANYALKCGVRHRLTVAEAEVRLVEA